MLINVWLLSTVVRTIADKSIVTSLYLFRPVLAWSGGRVTVRPKYPWRSLGEATQESLDGRPLVLIHLITCLFLEFEGGVILIFTLIYCALISHPLIWRILKFVYLTIYFYIKFFKRHVNNDMIYIIRYSTFKSWL